MPVGLPKDWIRGNEDLIYEDKKIFCKLCLKRYEFKRKWQLIKHLASFKHKQKQQTAANKQTETMVIKNENNHLEISNYVEDLVEVFLVEGIPLDKLNEGPMRNFLQKYHTGTLPSAGTVRSQVVPHLYEKTLSSIREEIESSSVWCSVGVATDQLGRNMVAIIVGKLDASIAFRGHLLHSTFMKNTNASTIVHAVHEALKVLWQGAPNTNSRLLLLVTDAAPYMLKAGRTLQVEYPKMVHTTCLAHALQRMAESVRLMYPDVNHLISQMKKVFLQAPPRVEVFKKVLPGVPLPSEPGTWLSAVKYYCDNFEGILKVVNELDAKEAGIIKQAKKAMETPGLLTKLIFIQVNFGQLPNIIEGLQKEVKPFHEAIIEVRKLLRNNWPGKIGERAILKLQNELRCNPGWDIQEAILARLQGEEVGEVHKKWAARDAFRFRYAPTTSAAVERVFDKYKYFLNNSTNIIENVNMHMIVFNYRNID